MQKIVFFLFLAAILLASFPLAKAANADARLRQQQIEILAFEISLLRSLARNMLLERAISAHSYTAVRMSDGAILLEKNAHRRYAVASVAKLMSALVALENIAKDQTITLTRSMFHPHGSSPSLYPGLKISMQNLLQASLIQSTNDAAHALAHFMDQKIFIAKMNQRARELGMKNTIFHDAHGFSSQNISSAADLVKLMRYIHEKHPQILAITKDNNFWLPDAMGVPLKFRNRNSFYPLTAFVGGKTGFLPQARHTFAGIFSVESEPIIIVLLRSQNHQADVFALLRQLQRARAPVAFEPR